MVENLKTKTVLLVEDNLDFVENAIILFELFVKTVYHAPTIAKAHEILENYPVDIIVSDIQLKQENGLDFIRDFRHHNLTTPIIIISGHKDEEFLFRSIPLNLTAYLLKPIKYDELIETLRICSEKLSLASQEIIELKSGWFYNTQSKILENGGEKYSLNKKETLFVELILKYPDRIITKEMLYASVWEYQEMSDSAVTNFILRIRRRFGKEFIHTLPDLGYRMSF